MKRAVIAIIVLAVLLFGLTGCGSDVRVDTPKTMHGLSCNVPTWWFETETDNTSNGGFSYKSQDEMDYLNISFVDCSLEEVPEQFPSPDERMATQAASYNERLDTANFSYSKISESVIDGAECSVYECVYKVHSIIGIPGEEIAYEAIIDKGDIHYYIMSNNKTVFDKVMASVHID